MGTPNPKKAWKNCAKRYPKYIGKIDYAEKSEMSELYSELKKKAGQFDGSGAQGLVNEINKYVKVLEEKIAERESRLKAFEDNYNNLLDAYNKRTLDIEKAGFKYENQVKTYLMETRNELLEKYIENKSPLEKETITEKIQELEKKLKKIGYKEVVEQ